MTVHVASLRIKGSAEKFKYVPEGSLFCDTVEPVSPSRAAHRLDQAPFVETLEDLGKVWLGRTYGCCYLLCGKTDLRVLRKRSESVKAEDQRVRQADDWIQFFPLPVK